MILQLRTYVRTYVHTKGLVLWYVWSDIAALPQGSWFWGELFLNQALEYTQSATCNVLWCNHRYLKVAAYRTE